jgi:hypothetical protein
MTERDEGPERIEDDAGVNHSIVVQLAKVLDRRDPLLIVFEVVDLRVRPTSGLAKRR